MKELKVKSFGPIYEANVSFGDLTILVGPQASGKSIFVQLLKFLIDKDNIRETFQRYNFIWGTDADKILDLYFGEGMSKIWNPDAEIKFDGKSYNKSFVKNVSGRIKGGNSTDEKLFYIPAQRILSVSDGRPKFFSEFDIATPFVLREFSERLRQLLQNGVGKSESIFPMRNRLKEPLRNSINESIFHDGKITMEERTGQKKLIMKMGDMSVPFITWSAGQKEFMPLLLGFYWLCPPAKEKRDSVKYVVIEEPEMGLHPEAIKSVILQVIDLLSRNYKVIISTHSPVLLEFAWAFNFLKKSKVKNDALFELFNIKKSRPTYRLFENIISDKTIRTYYFDRENKKVITKDISTLDAGSEDMAIAEWGGLSSFASKASELVSKIIPL